jgi:hypothetical protein
MLREVPDEQFNMNHWWLKDGMAFDDERNRMYKVADGPCGCAVGHMIQRGLLDESVLNPAGLFKLEYEHRESIWGAISKGLGLHKPLLAEFMFCQYQYHKHPITKADVIRRIEFVISELE